MAKDMFSDAIKHSNQITAVTRSFNRSMAMYCHAVYLHDSKRINTSKETLKCRF
jgi:hypothetical protein